MQTFERTKKLILTGGLVFYKKDKDKKETNELGYSLIFTPTWGDQIQKYFSDDEFKSLTGNRFNSKREASEYVESLYGSKFLIIKKISFSNSSVDKPNTPF